MLTVKEMRTKHGFTPYIIEKAIRRNMIHHKIHYIIDYGEGHNKKRYITDEGVKELKRIKKSLYKINMPTRKK
jgi:hypothetical protein